MERGGRRWQGLNYHQLSTACSPALGKNGEPPGMEGALQVGKSHLFAVKPLSLAYLLLLISRLFKILFFLIEVKLIYSIILDPSVQQNDSVLYIFSFSDSFPL